MMGELRSLNVQDVIARAASAFSRVSGRAVKLEQVQPLSQPDSEIWSCALLPLTMPAKPNRL
jgi:hypothetical protein